eukprot:4603583-Pleurochrysis_carterae.AAC.1
MYGLEPCMVVHKNQQVLISGVMCPHKRTRDIRMDEAAGIRRAITSGVVSMTGGVGGCAGGAS